MSSPIPTSSAPSSAPTASNSPPKVSITLSLSSTKYTFGTPVPTLNITATSHASSPITLSTFSTILDPHFALNMHQFRITDLETRTFVKQREVRYQFQCPPTTRLTLLPEEPVTLSEPFGPSGDTYPAMALNDPRRVGTLPGGARRSLGIYGVDGLEVGKEYSLGVSEYAKGCYWKWGTKEEVGKRIGSDNSDGEIIKFDPEEITEVKFSTEG